MKKPIWSTSPVDSERRLMRTMLIGIVSAIVVSIVTTKCGSEQARSSEKSSQEPLIQNPEP